MRNRSQPAVNPPGVPQEPVTIRRVVVALDASPHSRAALEAAVKIAARFEAELLGLFVEDVNLLRLAELPFVREIGGFSGVSRRLSTTELERQFRARVFHIRRAMRVATAAYTITWSLKVTRGGVAAEVLAAAHNADMLLVGRRGWSNKRLGSTARAAIQRAPTMAMMVEEGARIAAPLLVVYDGSMLAQKALDVAITLNQGLRQPLRILLLADGYDQEPVLRQRASALLDARRARDVRFRTLTESSVWKITFALHLEQNATLILPARLHLLHDEAVVKLLEEVDLPVLLVR